jgi:hypothetical protein
MFLKKEMLFNSRNEEMVMEYSKKHGMDGIGSIICGILGIVLVFIIAFIPLFLAIFAIGFGVSARKKGDGYGIWGLILGIATIILMIVVNLFIYYYVWKLY